MTGSCFSTEVFKSDCQSILRGLCALPLADPDVDEDVLQSEKVTTRSFLYAFRLGVQGTMTVTALDAHVPSVCDMGVVYSLHEEKME